MGPRAARVGVLELPLSPGHGRAMVRAAHPRRLAGRAVLWDMEQRGRSCRCGILLGELLAALQL